MERILTIAIPSFNRPKQLFRLLESIDCDYSKIDILICDDFSSNSAEIDRIVNTYKSKKNQYSLIYLKNSINLGFDANIRKLISNSMTKYVLFMGDDDIFIKNSLNSYISFLESNQKYPYILRSYIIKHERGHLEKFNYFDSSRILTKGEDTVSWLFKRSVSLSGFTINKELAEAYSTNELDGTLLYQVYLMSCICLNNNSIYCDIPVAQTVQSFRTGNSLFGSSQSENVKYKPGEITQDNSINFTKSYFEVANYIDKKFNVNILKKVKREISYYSYPFLSIQRKNGRKIFLEYAVRLEKNLDLGCTKYFYLYKWALYFFGEQFCDYTIILLKKIIGYTPNFGQKINSKKYN